MYIRHAAIAIVLLGVASPAWAQTANDPLSKVAAYEGTWHAAITHYATKLSKARTESNTVHNDCWRSGEYFACHQIVDGASAALVVFTYDSAKQLYHVHDVPADASDAPSGTLSINANTWTFPWQDKDGDKTVFFRVVNVFTDPRTIQYRQEFSYDNVNWTKTADGVEHRDP